MAKKTKKQARKAPAVAPAATTSSTTPSMTTSAFAPGLMTASRTSDAEFKPDYSATLKDLKRIGMLAGSFFIVLVILSFFLR
jgi:hypothetical protein